MLNFRNFPLFLLRDFHFHPFDFQVASNVNFFFAARANRSGKRRIQTEIRGGDITGGRAGREMCRVPSVREGLRNRIQLEDAANLRVPETERFEVGFRPENVLGERMPNAFSAVISITR